VRGGSFFVDKKTILDYHFGIVVVDPRSAEKGGQMKKICILIVLLMVPLLSAKRADIAPRAAVHATVVSPGDSPLDPAPPTLLQPTVGRGLGDILLTIHTLTLGIDGPSGLSWDGQYLYVVSLLNDSVYVVDPFVPSVIDRWASPPIASAPYGSGLEQNLWITTITPDSAYEYATSGTATGNVFLAAPSGALYCADGSEWWQNGEIWLVGIGSACGNRCFKFSVPDGAVLDSIGHPLWTAQSQRGLSFDPFAQKFWLGGWNSDSVWELNLDGSPTGRSFYMDGCAGIAYDWQSSHHPTPVLWVSRQGADQIVMVDADNPNPGIAEEPGSHDIIRFGFAATTPTMIKGQVPISYTTTVPGHVSLKVYDRIGRLVQTLVDEYQTAADKLLLWNGTDINNRAVANGVYFLRLEAENDIALRKLVLIR